MCCAIVGSDRSLRLLRSHWGMGESPQMMSLTSVFFIMDGGGGGGWVLLVTKGRHVGRELSEAWHLAVCEGINVQSIPHKPLKVIKDVMLDFKIRHQMSKSVDFDWLSQSVVHFRQRAERTLTQNDKGCLRKCDGVLRFQRPSLPFARWQVTVNHSIGFMPHSSTCVPCDRNVLCASCCFWAFKGQLLVGHPVALIWNSTWDGL